MMWLLLLLGVGDNFYFTCLCPLFMKKPVAIHMELVNTIVFEILICTEHTQLQSGKYYPKQPHSPTTKNWISVSLLFQSCIFNKYYRIILTFIKI